MPSVIYDYVDHDGHNPIKVWSLSLETIQLAKLNQKIDMLVLSGADLPPGLLSDTSSPHIKKIRIHGNVALRPLLCRGPINMQGEEFTFLAGCIEKDRQLPRGILDIAEQRRLAIINDQNRRIPHERISRKIKKGIS